MSCRIIVSSRFKKEAKKLAKKYRSLPQDLRGLNEELLENPYLGTRITETTYKIRLAITSKGRGKSGGARVITHVDVQVIKEKETTKIYFLSIYDKASVDNYSNAQVDKMIKQSLEEE